MEGRPRQGTQCPVDAYGLPCRATLMRPEFRTVRTLAGCACGDHDLDAPVQEYLISLIPLWSAPIGEVPSMNLPTPAGPAFEP